MNKKILKQIFTNIWIKSLILISNIKIIFSLILRIASQRGKKNEK